MTRLGAVILAVWMVACGGSSPPAEKPGRASQPVAEQVVPEATETPKEPEPVVEGPEEEHWAPREPDEDDGVEGGVAGGVLGGVPGGVAGWPPPPPPPPPPRSTPHGAQIAPLAAVEGQRIAGRKDLAPDDKVKLAMRNAGKDRLVVPIKMCLDATGTPTTASLLKSSGYPSYDALLTSTITKTWRYRPFMINGHATPVCTAVTFIYRQDNSDDE